MNTLDLHALMSEKNLTDAGAREWVRRRLKDGYAWSRLNPDLLSGEELLPWMTLDNPPRSPAALVPFPISAQRFKALDPDAPEYLGLLAREKINWCYQSRRKPGPAVLRRVIKQLAFYNSAPSTVGYYYYWFEPNPETSPFWPLMEMIFPALEQYRLTDPSLPQPPVNLPGEAWLSAPDAYDVSLRFSAFIEKEDSLILAAALMGKKPYWLRNYRLNPDRYSFIRQQLFYLLGDRMEPWQPGELPQPNSFRGMVYRKPKKKKGLSQNS